MLADNGAFPYPAAVPDALYRSLVWLDVRLGVLIAVALPLVLLGWAALRRETALLRLLGLYWKVASLLLIVHCVSMSYGYKDFKEQLERLPNYKIKYLRKDMLSKTRGPTMRVNVMQITRPVYEDEES